MGSAPDTARSEPPIEIETAPGVAVSVIWLHGLGADGSDFIPIVRELNLPPATAIRYIFPHAPYRPVTINGGHVMRAWYDLDLGERGLEQNPEHMRAAEISVATLVRRENDRGIPSSRVILAGFSQGGAVVLHAGLHFPETLAGILALSAPVPDAHNLAGEVNPANSRTPIFLGHGSQDPVVPFAMGETLRQAAQTRGLNVEWHEYDMMHSVCAEEIADIARWIVRLCPR